MPRSCRGAKQLNCLAEKNPLNLNQVVLAEGAKKSLFWLLTFPHIFGIWPYRCAGIKFQLIDTGIRNAF
jgi:hypothetical protein